MFKAKSAALDAVYSTAAGMHEAGVFDQLTMRKYEQLCRPSIPLLDADEIRRIRENANVSQAVFAALLNTSVSTVQKWEVGRKKPTGTALKLLHLVQTKGIAIVA